MRTVVHLVLLRHGHASVFNHSPAEGYLCCFQFGATQLHNRPQSIQGLVPRACDCHLIEQMTLGAYTYVKDIEMGAEPGSSQRAIINVLTRGRGGGQKATGEQQPDMGSRWAVGLREGHQLRKAGSFQKKDTAGTRTLPKSLHKESDLPGIFVSDFWPPGSSFHATTSAVPKPA